jgi:branched-chain amino acid transport system ATP-binding protein
MHTGALNKEGTPDEIQGDADVQRIYLGGAHG